MSVLALILYKCGWDPRTFVIHQGINAQIDQAFANVDLNLKHGGGKGGEQVFQLNSYHVPINDEALEADGVEF
ncbi:hypothetical protein N7449_007254 [Penicillium cf. viridicatum]|uniref:Uncharacterized protein n=1 Tax=Penicillium cf. viridicatum TaxID=2972119 RepID=A0A9W9JH10_9EURO|nr:hypothetical protein N7449_007254 [Penicillium cf. viridicatum]